MKERTFNFMVVLIFSLLLGCATSGKALRQGIMQNNEQMVIDSLNQGVNPNITDSEQVPLIISAVKLDSSSIVNRLIEAGVDVNAVDTNGATPLMWASVRGDSKVLQLLVSAGANVNATDQNGWTSLMYASAKGNNDIVQMLIRAGADVNVGARELDDSGHTTSALKIASYFGSVDVVKSLLEAKADVNFLDGRDDTALMVAIQKGHADIVKMLVLAGANTHTSAEEEYSHYNALKLAQFYNQIAVKKILLTEITVIIGGSQRTSLIIASIEGYDDVVKEIIARKKVNVNAKDLYGETALIYATQKGYANIVKMLIRAGANPNDVANYSINYTKPALMLAAENGDVDTVRILLASGANTEARFTHDGNQTILERAVLFGHIEVVKALIAAGAKINAKDGNGRTALDAAYNYPEIKKILKASGGKSGDDIKRKR